MDFCLLLIGLSPGIELCDSPFKPRKHSTDKVLFCFDTVHFLVLDGHIGFFAV